jgi:hypothetical protein
MVKGIDKNWIKPMELNGLLTKMYQKNLMTKPTCISKRLIIT